MTDHTPCTYCGGDEYVEFRDPDVGEMPCPACKPDDAYAFAHDHVTTLALSQARIDQDEWQQFRDQVVSEVNQHLDDLQPVAEAMDADEVMFEATFTLESGFDQHKARILGVHQMVVPDDGSDGV